MRAAFFTLLFFLTFLLHQANAKPNFAADGAKCTALVLPDYTAYNAERASYDFLIFAVASLEVYGDRMYPDFNVNNYDPEWKKIGRIRKITGMELDYYFRDGDTLDVLIAFRGTRATSPRDWYSNLAWFTRIIPLKNQYDSALDAFNTIAKEAVSNAKGRTVRFVTTGHSLGGDLAQHVALNYPCVSAAVFNASCVASTRAQDLNTKPRIVFLNEDRDELTRFCRVLSKGRKSKDPDNYPVNVVKQSAFQHPIEGYVAGMARMVSECQIDKRRGVRSHCAIPQRVENVRALYCNNYGRYGPDVDVCPDSP